MINENKKSESEESEEKSGKEKSLAERTSILEGIVATLGLILILFSISYISYQSFVMEGDPPDLVAKVSRIKDVTSGYLVEFKIKNRGDLTASNITIKGEIQTDDGKTETVTTTVNYIASGSEKKGGLLFSENPESRKLDIKAVGYENP